MKKKKETQKKLDCKSNLLEKFLLKTYSTILLIHFHCP